MSYPTKQDYSDDLELDDELDRLASEDDLAVLQENAADRGIVVEIFETAQDALEHIREEIPAGASVMNGHSTTLEEIGFVDVLKDGDHDWENLHDEVFAIEDDAERADARRRAQTADYFLGSVNGIAKTGELIAADASGSRIGAYPFAAKNLILVAGTNKVTDDLDAARERLHEFAYKLENERAKEAYGTESMVGKEVIIHSEGVEDRIHLVLIKERLGF